MEKKFFQNKIAILVSTLVMTLCLAACGEAEGITEEMPRSGEETYSQQLQGEESISRNEVTYTLSEEEKVKPETVSAPEINLPNFENTTIPTIYITTDAGYGIQSRDEYVSGNMIYDGKQYDASFRGRGNASWTRFAQRSYMIKLDEKESLLPGAVKARKWVLVSNFMDYSLMRNPIAQRMALYLNGVEYGMQQMPVDVFVDGKYEGVYVLSEKIDEGRGKVDLFSKEEYYPYDASKATRYGDLNNAEMAEEREIADEDVVFFFEAGYDLFDSHTYGQDQFITRHSTTLILQYPVFETANTPEAKAIQRYLNDMEQAFIRKQNITDYIDLDSWVDWFIVMEITNNTDSSFCRSTFFYKRPGEKVKLGPVWDFDMAYGNYGLEDTTYNSWCTGEPCFIGNQNHWMTDLLACDEFMLAVRARWDEIQGDFLDHMMQETDAMGQMLMASRPYQQALYGRGGWDSTDTIKRFITKRYNWIDSSIYMANFNRNGIPYTIGFEWDEDGNGQIYHIDENGNRIDDGGTLPAGENQLEEDPIIVNPIFEQEMEIMDEEAYDE
ncbi:MAG: CotH kinase family protein [Lachnospiraceae bacterium]|nr:CotH kinase family protein [Lachnospiraceae bacterium]